MMVCQNVGLEQPGEVVGRQRFVHFRWIFIDSFIDLLFRLAAVTGTIRILRGEGGVGGVGLDLIPLGKRKSENQAE